MARHVLVEINFAGERLGLTESAQSFSVEDDFGVVHSFEAGGVTVESLPAWSVPVSQSVGYGGDETIQITIFYGVLEMWNARSAFPIEMSRVDVWWWEEGKGLSQRYRIFTGVISNPVFTPSDDTDGWSLTFDATADKRNRVVVFPPHSILDAGRFPSAPTNARGAACPVIYGAVDGLQLNAVTSENSDPVRMIVAGHRIVSDTIQVWRDTTFVGAREVKYAFDGLGDLYAYVEVTKAEFEAGSSMYARGVVGWASAHNTPIDRLGDVMEHVVITYGGNPDFIDWQRVRAATPSLNRFLVGAFMNDATENANLETLLTGRFGDQFPVSVSYCSGLVGWDCSAFPGVDAPVVMSLNFDQETMERDQVRRTPRTDILTTVKVEFGYDGFDASNIKSIVLNHENHEMMRGAKARWGTLPSRSVRAVDCPDASTAYAVGWNVARSACGIRTIIGYLGADDFFWALPKLSVIAVTDSRIGLAAAPFVLFSAVPRRDGKCDINLISLEAD